MSIQEASKRYLRWFLLLAIMVSFLLLITAVILGKSSIILNTPSTIFVYAKIPSYTYNRLWDIAFIPLYLLFCKSLPNIAANNKPWLDEESFKTEGYFTFFATAIIPILFSLGKMSLLEAGIEILMIAIPVAAVFSLFKTSIDIFLAMATGSICGVLISIGLSQGFMLSFLAMIVLLAANFLAITILRMLFWGIIENVKSTYFSINDYRAFLNNRKS